VAPIILLSRTDKRNREDRAEALAQHREDRDADWARQDQAAALLLAKQEEQAAAAAKAATDLAASQKEIADKASEAAQLLADAQAETIRRSEEVSAAAAREAELAAQRDTANSLALQKIDAQAQRIHTLVNSDRTAAWQSQRDQTVVMVAVLRRVIALAESRGQAPDQQDVDALAIAERRVAELDAILADRQVQLRIVEAAAAVPGAVDLDSPAGGLGGQAAGQPEGTGGEVDQSGSSVSGWPAGGNHPCRGSAHRGDHQAQGRPAPARR
jgi:hypothetical protein